jgi:NAD(P)-dependent dehydrogenase (short-subunit alcohol dehydrogenase family)
MRKKKTYAVFGLGRYGQAVATELVEGGMEVLAVDTDQKIVNDLAATLPICKCADVTDPEVIARLGVADIDTDSELWNILVNDFGSKRKQTCKYSEIAFSNAFIGNYLRCELLMRNGLKEQLEEDIRGYFLGMAKRTGTLWEHDSVMASCNHGFASHVLMWLDYLNYLQ